MAGLSQGKEGEEGDDDVVDPYQAVIQVNNG